MKKLTLILLLCAGFFAQADNQLWYPGKNNTTHSVTIAAGYSNFFGDLGKYNPSGFPLLGDLYLKNAHAALSIGHFAALAPRIGISTALTYTRLSGDDNRNVATEIHSGLWFRNQRNLHFRTDLAELASQIDLSLLNTQRHRWTPYLAAGVGLFWFNPKAQYNGEWVALQPLGTEGQTLAGGSKYSRLQVSIPLSFGIRVQVSDKISLGVESSFRVTTTDFLDDVSRNYIDAEALYSQKTPQEAEMIAYLSNPSTGISNSEKRGGESARDYFSTMQVKMTYTPESQSRKSNRPTYKNSPRQRYW